MADPYDLIRAVCNRDLEALHKLIEKGVDLNRRFGPDLRTRETADRALGKLGCEPAHNSSAVLAQAIDERTDELTRKLDLKE